MPIRGQWTAGISAIEASVRGDLANTTTIPHAPRNPSQEVATSGCLPCGIDMEQSRRGHEGFRPRMDNCLAEFGRAIEKAA